MSVPRWLPVFVLAAWIGLAALASEASAQVFRARSGKGAPVAKAAPGPTAKAGATEPAAGARKATAAPPKAKKAAASSSRRTAGAKKKHRKPREAEASDDDEVTVQDDDE
jgi:hypothetical protein